MKQITVNQDHFSGLMAGKVAPTAQDAANLCSILHRSAYALQSDGAPQFGVYVDPEGGASSSPKGKGLIMQFNRKLKAAFGPIETLNPLIQAFIGLIRMRADASREKWQSQGRLRSDIKNDLYALIDDASEMVKKNPCIFGELGGDHE